MGRPTDKPTTAAKVDFPRRKSGRASFDADGRGIWEWQTATGVFERNVTSEQLANLEDSNLSIVDDAEPAGRTIYGDAAPTRPLVAPAKPAHPSTVLSRLLKKFG